MNKNNNARIWKEKVSIPTYEIGQADLCPHFFEKRLNQGASGRVYPWAFTDKISDNKIDKEYQAVFLENKYIKIMVLPELGGRVQMAYDKIAQRHFVYHNQVIKPALIGCLGPWISGGIEFNWPMHHRPSTYQPLDYSIEDNDDGTQTLWICEHDKMFHLRQAAGYTILPDKAYLKLSVKIYNGTDLRQNFMWWANIAVKSDNAHQHVFPPDVKGVYFHARSDSGQYPIMTGNYCGMDFTDGIDVSYNDNIPAATSFMALPSRYDFCGAYSHDENGGILHIADAGISPGKKLFTWGHQDYAKGWERNLTDEDGPYLELMAGVFTDNQPDFAWLAPHEEKRFDEYFLPYTQLGVVKNAGIDGALKLNATEEKFEMGVYATGTSDWTVVLKVKGKEVYSENISVSPEKVWTKEIPHNNDFTADDVFMAVLNDDIVVLDCHLHNNESETPPAPAEGPKPPADINSTDELLIIGEHIEQYLHASASAEDYYLEGLKRDTGDSRCNLAMGRLLLRRGNFKKAVEYLQTAWQRMTIRNSNPSDGEICFLMGLCYEYLGRWDDAWMKYYKSVWNGAWQSQGFLALARLAARKGNYSKAREFAENSLNVNGLNKKARHLAVILARLQGDKSLAEKLVEEYLADDPVDFAMLYEKYLLSKDPNQLDKFLQVTRQNDHNFIELVVDYARSYQRADAFDLLELLENPVDPMVYFHQAYYCNDKATELIEQAESLPLSPCFPNRLEDIAVLKFVINITNAPKANYLLGNLYYDKRQYDLAMKYWQASEKLNSNFATIHRNLAIGHFNKIKNAQAALREMEIAISLNEHDPRLIFEINELHKQMKFPLDDRIKFLAKHQEHIKQRDDLTLEWATINNLTGHYKEALKIMTAGTFHPWECGEGLLGKQYVISHLALGGEALSEKRYSDALALFEKAMHLPDCFGEGKLPGATDNDLKYFAGLTCQLLNDTSRANEYFNTAAKCDQNVYSSMATNQLSPAEYIFFRGLACRKLKDEKAAQESFYKLINYANEHIDDQAGPDFLEVGFTTTYVFDENLQDRNRTYCNFLLAMGHIGLGHQEKGKHYLKETFEINPAYSYAKLLEHLILTDSYQ